MIFSMCVKPLIILGIIWPGGSALNQAVFQLGNQSYNAAVNYANKNKVYFLFLVTGYIHVFVLHMLFNFFQEFCDDER